MTKTADIKILETIIEAAIRNSLKKYGLGTSPHEIICVCDFMQNIINNEQRSVSIDDIDHICKLMNRAKYDR